MSTLIKLQTDDAIDALRKQNTITDEMRELAAQIAKGRLHISTKDLEDKFKTITLSANPHLATLGHDETLGDGEKLIRRQELRSLIEETIKQAANSEGIAYRPPAELSR